MSIRLARLLLDLAWLLAMPAVLLILLGRLLEGKSRRGWGQRVGAMPRVGSGPGPCIWVHAVSVGEVNLAATLIRELRGLRPDARFVITTITDTGQARARELFAEQATVAYLPLDFSICLSIAFSRVRPDLLVLVELELWPGLVLTARAWGVPVVVLNGRMTQRAFGRYRIARPLIRRLLVLVDRVAAQTQPIAERFLRLGLPADRLRVTGTAKFDAALAPVPPAGPDLLAGVGLSGGPDEPLWLCGQTGEVEGIGEERVCLLAYARLREQFPRLRLVLAPRQIQRADAVHRIIEQSGFACQRRSQYPAGGAPAAATGDGQANRITVGLLDTLGELRSLYPCATVAFVGRSLVRLGGSDVLEAAALTAVVTGPHTENFAEPAGLLRDAGAMLQLDASLHQEPESAVVDRLVEALGGLLRDKGHRADLLSGAAALLELHRGSARRQAELAVELLRTDA